MVLGLPKLDIKNQLRGFFDASVAQALNTVIPGYTGISAWMRRTIMQKNLHKDRPQTAANTIDEPEYNDATSNILNQISGTFNPFKNAWYMIQRLFGYTYSERIQTSLNVFNEDAHKYDSYQFANRSLKLLVSQMNKRISSVEGILSKTGFYNNPKVTRDAAVQGFKQAIAAWLQPFMELIHGGIKGYGFTGADWDFLMELRDVLAYGSVSKYTKDVVGQFDQVLQEARSAWKAKFDEQARQRYQANLAKNPHMKVNGAARAPGQSLAMPA